MIFPHLLCCKVCPRRYPKGLISLLATSDRSSEVIIVLGHGQILLRHSLLLFGVQLPFLPSLVVLGYSLIFGLGIRPDPFLCNLYIWDYILDPAFPNAIWTYETIGPHNNFTQYFFIRCKFWQIYCWITYSSYILHACKIYKKLEINSYVINKLFKLQIFIV